MALEVLCGFPLTTVIERTGALGKSGPREPARRTDCVPRGLEQVLGVSVTEMGVSPLYHSSFWQELREPLFLSLGALLGQHASASFST